METGSVFGIYGQLFGWHVFDQAINFIAISGLWAVPFIVFVYRHSFGNRERGQGHDPVGSLVCMELSIYVAILLIAFFLYPLASMPKADFKHTVTTSTGTITSSIPNQSMYASPRHLHRSHQLRFTKQLQHMVG